MQTHKKETRTSVQVLPVQIGFSAILGLYGAQIESHLFIMKVSMSIGLPLPFLPAICKKDEYMIIYSVKNCNLQLFTQI
jgi:hypothetical protein